ncbi:hypothetical protein R6Q57_012664 [Mikania cordata]
MERSHRSNGSEGEQQGTMSIVTTAVSIGDLWEVQYARFFNCPSPSTVAGAGGRHPSLVPLAKKPKGSWISSFNSLACLKLLTTTTDHSDTYRSIILTVTLVNNIIIEEHYISKLHFTWPQVSCSTGYFPRGSKVVFMSYNQDDQAIHSNLIILFVFAYFCPLLLCFFHNITNKVFCCLQIQKFAVRFLTIDEAERFVNVLKEAFGHERIIGSTSGISKSKTSSESEIIPSFEAENRPIQEYSPIAASSETYVPPFHPNENYDGSLNSNHLSQDVQGKLSAFPPSFTSLLMNCYPVAETEMLSKVQKVVNEFEDNLLV